MAALGTRGGGCPVGQLLGEPLELGLRSSGERLGLSMEGQAGRILAYVGVAPHDGGMWRGRRPPWGGGEVRNSVTLGYGWGSAGGWQLRGLSAPSHPVRSQGISDSQAE